MSDAVLVARSITRQLSMAVEQGDAAALQRAFDVLCRMREVDPEHGHVDGLLTPNDLYIYTCEAAITLQQGAIAEHCLNQLLTAGTNSSKTSQIRMLFCRGAFESHKATVGNLRGRALQVAAQAALGHVLKGIRIALGDGASLAYLVVAGAAHAWNACWVLFKEGTFHAVCSAIGFVVQALEKIEHHDVSMRLSWLSRHATALAGCGKTAEAQNVIQRATDLATRVVTQCSSASGAPSPLGGAAAAPVSMGNAAQLAAHAVAAKTALFRCQVALSKLVANPKLKQDAPRGTMRGILAAQSVICGAAEGPAAEAELLATAAEIVGDIKAAQELAAANAAAAAAATTSPDSAAKKGGLPAATAAASKKDSAAASPTSVDDMREDVLAEVAFALATLDGSSDKASDLINRTPALANTKRLRARVFVDYAMAFAQAKSRGGVAVHAESAFNSCTPEMLQDIIAAMRRVDRALESAVRIPDPTDRAYVVQLGATLVWNLGLPLLQSKTRAAVARPFQTALKALQDVGSNMNSLLAAMNYEMALVDADSDYITKAITRLDHTLTCDYVADAEEQKRYGLAHPMDRLAAWEKRRLTLRGNSYAKPTGPEDEAIVLLEQARDADPHGRLSILTRVRAILLKSEPPSDYWVEAAAISTGGVDGGAPTGKGKAAASPAPKKAAAAKGDAASLEELTERVDPNAEHKRLLLRVRAQLWHDALRLSWGVPHPDLDTVRGAAERLLLRVWQRRGDRDMRVAQLEAVSRLVECLVLELEREGGLYIGQRDFLATVAGGSDGGDDDDLGADAFGDLSRDDGNAVDAAAAKMTRVAAAVKPLQSYLIKMASLAAELCGISLASASSPLGVAATATGSVSGGAAAAASATTTTTTTSADDVWAVCNAATLAWNVFIKAFSVNDFLTSMPVLEVIFPLMFQANVNVRKECGLVRDIGVAYVRGLQYAYIRERNGWSVESLDDMSRLAAFDFTKPPSSAPGSPAVAYFGTPAEASAHPRLAKAIEVCEKMIACLPTAMDSAEFVFSAAVVRYWQGKAPDPRTLPQLKCLTAIAQITLPPLSTQATATADADRRNALQAGFDALKLDPNIELCAKFAEQACRVPGGERLALKACSVGQDLYTDGLLGQRQLPESALAPPGGVKAAPSGKDVKGAKGAAASAVQADSTMAVNAAPPTPCDVDWMWYSTLLQRQGIATLTLISPALQGKATQIGIRKQALSAFANAAMAALKAPSEVRAALVMKAIRLYAANLEDTSSAASRTSLIASLKRLLSQKVLAAVTPSTATPPDGGPSDVDALGQLFLVVARGCRDAGRMEDGLHIMKTALKVLPTSHHRPFWDLDVELRCAAGLPLNATLLRVKEYSPQIQARVWLAVARCSPDVNDQRFAYCNAARVLQGAGDAAEHGQYLLMFAQWLLKVNDKGVSLHDVRGMVLSAVDGVSDRLDSALLDGGGEGQGDRGSTVAGSRMDGRDDPMDSARSGAGGRSPLTRHSSDASSVHAARSGSIGAASVATTKAAASGTHREAANRPTVPAFLVAVEAYVLLSTIAGSGSVDVDGVPVSKRQAAAAGAHYVVALWQLIVAAANSHVQRQKARQSRNEARAQQVAAAAGATKFSGGAAALGDKTKKATKTVTLAEQPPAADISQSAAGASLADELIALPVTVDGWVGYRWPAALVGHMRSLSKSPQAISSTTIEDPNVFIAVLLQLARMLQEAELAAEAFPVLGLAQLCAETLLPAGPLQTTLLHTAQLHAYILCVQNSGSAAWLIQPAGANKGIPLGSALPHFTSLEKAALSEDTMLGAAQAGRNPNGAAARVMEAVSSQTLRQVYGHWVALARLLMWDGRVAAARSLLVDATAHAEKYHDHVSLVDIAILRARILGLEGRFDAAQKELSRAVWNNPHTSIDALGDALTAQVTLLLGQQRLDDALDIASRILPTFEYRMQTAAGGIELELARIIVPDAAARTLSRCVKLLYSHIDTQSRFGLFTSTSPGWPDAASSSASGKGGVSLHKVEAPTALWALQRIIKSSIAGVSLLSNVASGDAADLAFAEALTYRLLLFFVPSSGLKTRAQVLASEASALDQSVRMAKRLLHSHLGGDVLADGRVTRWRTAPHVRLASALAVQSRNLTDRVALRRRIVAEYRRSNVTEVAFPKVDGAEGEALEGRVVDFMRSTKKERDMAVKRLRRKEARALVEAQRAAARQERQIEVEKRREAKRQETEAARAAGKDVTAAAAAGKPAAAKTGGKGGAAQPVVDLDPDVDPQDACGIPSAPGSEDDGSGEDTVEEDVAEVTTAVSWLVDGAAPSSATCATTASPRGAAGSVVILSATVDQAIVTAASAQELLGDDLWGIAESAGALRAWYTSGAAGQDARRAIVEAPSAHQGAPLYDESAAVRGRWQLPVDVGAEEAANAAENPAGATGGKGPAGGGATGSRKPEPKVAATGKAGGPKGEAAPAPAASQVKPQGPPARPPAPLSRRPPGLASALLACERALIAAHQQDDSKLLARIARELAELCVLSPETHGWTGHCVALGVAARNQGFLAEVWSASAPPDVVEQSLLRLSRHTLLDICPPLGGSPPPRTAFSAAVAKASYSSSKFLTRIRVPDAAVSNFCSQALNAAHQLGGPESAAAAAQPVAPPTAAPSKQAAGSTAETASTSSPLAATSIPAGMDVCVLNVLLTENAYLIAAFHRPGQTGAADVRRCVIDISTLQRMEGSIETYCHKKRAAMSSTNPAASTEADAGGSQFETDVLGPCREWLYPLLHDFELLFDAMGPRHHLVLCLDPMLHALPWEWLPALARFRSVSRDISLFTCLSRLARRQVDRYSAAAATFLVDVHREHPGAAAGLFAPDETPKSAQWLLMLSPHNTPTSATEDDATAATAPAPPAAATAKGSSAAAAAASPAALKSATHNSSSSHSASQWPLSIAQLQRAVLNPAAASTLIVSVCGSFSNTLPLSAWCAMDLSHVRVAILLDFATNAASNRRQNQADIVKAPMQLKRLEAPWCVNLLLLARGCDCVVGHGLPIPISTKMNDSVGRCLTAHLERPPPIRSLAETLRMQLHRSLALDPKKQLALPAEGDAYGLFRAPLSDRAAFAVFGVCPDDSLVAGGGTERGAAAKK